VNPIATDRLTVRNLQSDDAAALQEMIVG